MKKSLWLWALALALFLPAQAIRAEGGTSGPVDPAYAAEYEQAVSALLAHTPGAVVDYALRERDDGRWQWELFFSQGASMGVCKVLEDSNTIRKVELYDKAEGALTADQAVQKLMSEKGASAIVELDLDREGGGLYYEGECEVGGRRYEFEMADDGSIIEWERD